ncbi:hypothetical protein PV325_007798 [Microctonus aethiopoides]|nr:hypothetical protein PV325_007798 [Microctonus aethiopoides]KAK0079700.1 hypothetical protein PV326_008593 [Microctonus aethiopoides]
MGVSSDEGDTATKTKPFLQQENPLLRRSTFSTTSFANLTEIDETFTESTRVSTQSTVRFVPDTMTTPTTAEATIRTPQF